MNADMQMNHIQYFFQTYLQSFYKQYKIDIN